MVFSYHGADARSKQDRLETGLGQSDLANLLGSRSRASEIMRGKRALTMEQAYKLHREWHIPADVLLRPFVKPA